MMMFIICLFQGDHTKVKPMVVALAIMTIFSFSIILFFSPTAVATALLSGISCGYLFVVNYSLYKKLEEQNKGGLTQYHQF